MSLPLLLLVDDSEAVLAYQTAALSGEYAIATAVNGAEGLQRMRELRPAVVLLDLSMPVMSGDELLARAQADAELSAIPVIVVSSEQRRAAACLRAGARLSVPKPARAEALRAAVAQVLAEDERRRREGTLLALVATLGRRRIALPLDQVRAVVLQPATRPLHVGPSYLGEFFEVEGAPVCVVDLSRALREQHLGSYDERKLVLVKVDQALLALSFDAVGDPEEIAAADFSPRPALAPDDQLLAPALKGVVRVTGGESVPLFDPRGLLSRGALRRVHRALGALAPDEVSP